MTIPHFEREFRVHVYETFVDEKANICALFNYMQDIAAEHAIRLGYGRDDLMKENNFWVLSRMYAEISEYPFRDERITVKTWPFGTDNVFALRFFDLKFPDGRTIAKASSSWLIIDAETKRIRRPDQTLEQLSSYRKSHEMPVRIAEKIRETPAGGKVSDRFRVKVSDLDVNMHTNNVNYLKWTIDSYDFDFMLKHFPVSVEINYLAESVLGDNITIRTSGEGESTCAFTHSIMKDEAKELCRIRIEWKERKN
ncbi:MAG TPA: thioesterase [Bacteroidales bacterium]|nr:thioesterase [Bacteroidales bacterium]